MALFPTPWLGAEFVALFIFAVGLLVSGVCSLQKVVHLSTTIRTTPPNGVRSTRVRIVILRRALIMWACLRAVEFILFGVSVYLWWGRVKAYRAAIATPTFLEVEDTQLQRMHHTMMVVGAGRRRNNLW